MPDKQDEPYTLESPLKKWPGTITLPPPDDFDGIHWRAWKDGMNKPKRKSYAQVHLYCYAGLELIDTYGGWDMEIPLQEVQAWENKPADERIKLVAWIGREMRHYMDGILDPKE